MWPNTGLAALALCGLALAQFPPAPENVTVLESKLDDGVTISYKEPGICETTPGVKSYAGYIHLPPGTLEDLGEEQDYPINTFFWFFESRKDPANAPLSIWLNGGPGSSSLLGLFAENGPCYVNPDSNSTTLSEWAWNNEVNMLYLDQPVQVGLSYDVLQNITTDLVTGEIAKLGASDPVPEQNVTFRVGTYPSQARNQTALGSRNAAIALWHFAQVWFQEFPGYHPNDSRVSLATESYGGRYGPAIASFFAEQNAKIANGTWHDRDGGANYVVDLDTLVLINSCIDRQVQWPAYPHIAYNNTYGLQTVNASVYHAMVDALERPGGCADQVTTCRELASAYDPDNVGANATVNRVCADAENFCSSEVRGPYLAYSGRNYYDMASVDPSPFPASFYYGYLNQPHVQRALGAPLNFTQSSGAVSAAFRGIGDYPRPGWTEDLGGLLAAGVKVHLVYGDRDYACNWLGGEAVSLAIPWAGADAFRAAGYADLVVNGSYVGGQVRQHGNLSFARVYQAGHEVPSYQPETAYRVFVRALFNRDIATGSIDTAAQPAYATNGSADTWAIKNEDPPDILHYCYVQDIGSTCTEDQVASILDGSATIVGGIVKDRNSTLLFPDIFAGLGDDDDATSTTTPTASTPAPTATGTDEGAATPDSAGTTLRIPVAAGSMSLAVIVAMVVQALRL
ncbi:carboxypeptidase S1 [Xylariomycetidae sp. FL0641]|nr:carboxypeptidase S1 [Xylariomycetidae sp. FL0641]